MTTQTWPEQVELMADQSVPALEAAMRERLYGKREEVRRGPWILTQSGQKFYPFDPRPEEVKIADVAAALSKVCRFGGHTRQFVSVAQHAVHVADYLTRRYGQVLGLKGLNHDDGETYLGDVPRPWKGCVRIDFDDRPVRTFKAYEDQLLEVIYVGLGVEYPTSAEWKLIKHADLVLLATEYRDLMPQSADWKAGGWPCEEAGHETLPFKIEPWSCDYAEREFLHTFAELSFVGVS